MKRFSRRDFMKLGALLAAAAGLPGAGGTFAAGLKNLADRRARVLWIQGQSCSGCSVSLLNSESPKPLDLLLDYIDLLLHQTLGAAQGHVFEEVLESASREAGYFLVMEGSIPLGMPEACVIAGRPLSERLPPLIRGARYVVAAGTCASYGGIPAAEGNPTGAVSLKTFMEKSDIPREGKLVQCPSCPTHPNSLVGTLAYLGGEGYPEVHPELFTPKMYYSHSTHDDCPRFHYYSKHIFSERFGDAKGCLFKLGCLGPLSFTECPRRQWNNGVNWCIRASAPCIGCSHSGFAHRKDFPFYRKQEEALCQFAPDRPSGAGTLDGGNLR